MCRDLIDCFIQEIRKAEGTDSAFAGRDGGPFYFNFNHSIFSNPWWKSFISCIYDMVENNLIGTMIDLYFAGTDTTTSTLAWMILYLSKMPQIQKKFQDEIEAVTGNTRQCSVTDKPK
jgi:hypothetical protein